MNEYDEMCIQEFLKHQLQLFPEPVAETPEEAEEFLEICFAAVCDNIKEVRQYFDDAGADISGMTKKDFEEAEEVFCLPDGRYLVILA
ncbi:MAG: glyoxalase [Lachnospiraceae bacterium]|nr:glyoxalase [Clostridiales bacterium]MCC8142264.1 glyoxalase [Lachnospiraceae bacterium]